MANQFCPNTNSVFSKPAFPVDLLCICRLRAVYRLNSIWITSPILIGKLGKGMSNFAHRDVIALKINSDESFSDIVNKTILPISVEGSPPKINGMRIQL
ncbi:MULTISPECIES: hypothetical protein [Sphingobacterium]|uniref:hypothetical protein n=1 Tax=Sphingobacterium TaxID=28453 RepID=UPI00131535CF|nr:MULTISPECIES: hypothetical protein [Sphingobacterium]